MRKVLFCLGCLSWLLASAALAQAAPQSAPSSSLLGAACTGVADAGLTALFEETGDLPGVGVPAPAPRACEHNFCSLAKDACATQCAPCGIDFRCRNVACDYSCVCVC